MVFTGESASGAPVEAYHHAALGAPVGADPMALMERPAVGVVSLRAPGYRPITPPPTPGATKRGTARDARRPRWLVALVTMIVTLAAIGAVLAGIFWR